MTLEHIESEVRVFMALAHLHLHARYEDVLRRDASACSLSGAAGTDDVMRYASARLAVVNDAHVMPERYAARVVRTRAFVELPDELGMDEYVEAVAKIYFEALLQDDPGARDELEPHRQPHIWIFKAASKRRPYPQIVDD
ncbi:hypothetical protein Q5752_001468 [Cryptotrichosporon argae]